MHRCPIDLFQIYFLFLDAVNVIHLIKCVYDCAIIQNINLQYDIRVDVIVAVLLSTSLGSTSPTCRPVDHHLLSTK